MRSLTITIDGPAGAGKTTVSRKLASKLNFGYLDTGALYRAVALAAKSAGISPDDDRALEKLCQNLDLEFLSTPDGPRLLCNGEDVTGRIRTPEITMMASQVSARPVVRKALLDVQRKIGQPGKLVAEGRDMGTVVFPDADVKFFLMASVEERARRRFEELAEDANQTLEEVKRDIRKRDENDQSRALAPLKPAPDAIMIDTTMLDVDEVVEKMLSHIPKF